jgi:hypothetical protein
LRSMIRISMRRLVCHFTCLPEQLFIFPNRQFHLPELPSGTR